MDNPNFSFLKEEYPEIYNSCNMIDSSFIYAEGEYKYPVALSILTLEEVMKFKLNRKSGDLFDLINIYCEEEDVPEDLCSDLHTVRKKGNAAKHNNKSFNRNEAVKVVEKLQSILKKVLDIYEYVPRYKEVTGDEEWFNPVSKQESEDYKLFYEKLIESENRSAELEDKLFNVENQLKDLIEKFDIIASTTVKFEDLQDLNNQNNVDEFNEKINEMEQEFSNFNLDEVNAKISELSTIVTNLEKSDEITQKLDELSDIKNRLNEFEGLKIYLNQLLTLPEKYEDLENIKNKLETLENSIEYLEDFENVKEQFNDLSNTSEEVEIETKLNGIIEYNKKSDYNALFEDINDLKDSYNKISNVSEKIPDDTQLDAIEYGGDKLIINAGPGSGKTFVLIERVKYLIKNGALPESLLIITFTEKAAEELRYRLINESGLSIDVIDQMQISTIHSACRVILKDYYSSGLEVIDDSDNERKRLFIKKHKEELGFTKYAHIPDSELKIVARKFDDFSIYNVDTEKLEKRIIRKYFTKKTHLKKEERYKNLIDSIYEEQGEDFIFPESEVYSEKLTKRWTYNKYLAIIQAYQKYIDLLDSIKSYDFNHLINKTKFYLENPKNVAYQDLIDSLGNFNRDSSLDKSQTTFEAINYLKENRDMIRFKNILVDEFQDTDAVQMKIFELLIEGSETVTFVGDPDQAIFGFRGSDNKFLYDLLENDDFKRIDLLVNYRAPQNIIDFNEKFIRNHGRKLHKQDIKSDKSYDGDLYYLDSKNAAIESQKVVSIIKQMKELGKINKYSDVGILFRTKWSMNPFIKRLTDDGINFHVQGNADFKEYPEVNSVMLLLWYLTSTMPTVGFDLKDFCRENTNSKYSNDVGFDLDMFNLDESTKEIIMNYEGSEFEFTTYNRNQLMDLGITNEHDLSFFEDLNNLKSEIHLESDSIEVLDVYYSLFKITNYIENKFKTIDEEELEDNVELLNLGLLSRKIHDYMETYSRDNVDDLFNMLFEYYADYSSPKNVINDDDCVQLLTIHKAKGLEFPVVFVCSIKEGLIPTKNKSNENDPYPIPNDYKYPEIAKRYYVGGKFEKLKFNSELNRLHLEEEYRILYVALTRSASTLIISHVQNNNKKSNLFLELLNDNPEFSELTDDLIPTLRKVESIRKDLPDELNLSFTSLEHYMECPHKYNLIYNYDFVSPQNIYMRVGTIVHSILNKLNLLAIAGEDVDDWAEPIIKESIESNSDLVGNPVFENIIGDLEEYWPEAEDWTILETEFPFTIKRFNYNLKGQIDLMKESPYGITLVDFKTTSSEDMDMDNTRYYDQLHFYHLAMKDNSKYSDIEDIDLELFSVKDFEQVEVPFSQERVNQLEGNLHRVYTKISQKDYYPTEDESSCNSCLLRSLCGKN